MIHELRNHKPTLMTPDDAVNLQSPKKQIPAWDMIQVYDSKLFEIE